MRLVLIALVACGHHNAPSDAAVTADAPRDAMIDSNNIVTCGGRCEGCPDPGCLTCCLHKNVTVCGTPCPM